VSARRLHHRLGATALVALAAFAAGTASASAGALVASAPSCDDQALAKPFLPWLDVADYTALPGGDFEGAGGDFSLTGGATVAGANESYYVGAASDAGSLSLPAGGSATSPTMCVGLEHPTVRFFAKRRSGGLLSTLRVEALVETATGAVVSTPVGSVAATGSWQPTLPMPMAASLLPLLPGEHTPVAFRFTAQGGDFSVDDVWVDPYARR
jgi:hypothetical protein